MARPPNIAIIAKIANLGIFCIGMHSSGRNRRVLSGKSLMNLEWFTDVR
jgi:hypothetical protein